MAFKNAKVSIGAGVNLEATPTTIEISLLPTTPKEVIEELKALLVVDAETEIPKNTARLDD